MKTLILAQVFRATGLAVFGCLENRRLGFSGGFLTQLTEYGRKKEKRKEGGRGERVWFPIPIVYDEKFILFLDSWEYVLS